MSIADLERDLGLPAGTAQPCSWRNALYRPEAPGARLDGQPWARSWPAYLRSVFDPEDASARTFIANAMSERIPAEGGFLIPEILRSQVFSYDVGGGAPAGHGPAHVVAATAGAHA